MYAKIISAAILLMSSTAVYAADVSSNMNNLPIFYSLTGNNGKYHDAAFKAQQAFFVQTGIQRNVDVVTGAATKQATNTATTTINDNTFLNAKDVFFVFGAAYAIGVKKQVVQKVKDPFIPGLMHTFSAGKDTYSTGIGFSW